MGGVLTSCAEWIAHFLLFCAQFFIVCAIFIIVVVFISALKIHYRKKRDEWILWYDSMSEEEKEEFRKEQLLNAIEYYFWKDHM